MKKIFLCILFTFIFSTVAFADDRPDIYFNELMTQLDLDFTLDEDLDFTQEDMYYNSFLALNKMGYMDQSEGGMLLQEYENYADISSDYSLALLTMAQNGLLPIDFAPNELVTIDDVFNNGKAINKYLKNNGYKYIYRRYFENINNTMDMDLAICYATAYSDSPIYLNNISIRAIIDGSIYDITPAETSGYNPTLFFGDFTGDKINDIFINTNSGGSGGFTYNEIFAFDFTDNSYKSVFNNANYLKDIDVSYQDFYKVVATSSTEVKVFDISKKPVDYLADLYDKNGKLKEKTTGFANMVSNCYPIDIDFNGVYEIMLRQKIAGLYNADTIGYIDTIYGYDNGSFIEIK